MAVAFGSIVSFTPATGTGGTSPSITTPVTNPVVIVGIALRHASATVSSVAPNTFGGTATEITNIRTANAGFEVLTSVWRIVAPTPNTAGTVTVTLDTSVPYQIVVATYSGAHQTNPCPGADAQTSVQSATPFVLTPSNLALNDASFGMVGSHDSDTLGACAPNGRYLDNTTTCTAAAGDSTGTTGVTFNNNGFNKALVAVRIAEAAAGAGASTEQIMAAVNHLAGSGGMVGRVYA